MGEAKRRAARGDTPVKNKAGGYYDRDAEVRNMAAGMHERVGQLKAAHPSISDHALSEQMVAFLPNLNHIWTTTSDEVLENLCSEYPGFYHYAHIMEEAFEARRKNPDAYANENNIELLPEHIRPMVQQLMTQAATMEREMQSTVNIMESLVNHGTHVNLKELQVQKERAHAVKILQDQWTEGLNRLADALHEAQVPTASARLLASALGAMNDRIAKISDRLVTVILAGQVAARAAQDNADPVM